MSIVIFSGLTQKKIEARMPTKEKKDEESRKERLERPLPLSVTCGCGRAVKLFAWQFSLVPFFSFFRWLKAESSCLSTALYQYSQSILLPSHPIPSLLSTLSRQNGNTVLGRWKEHIKLLLPFSSISLDRSLVLDDEGR
jgi:hypothetical protein